MMTTRSFDILRSFRTRLHRQWRRNDQRYGWKWRAANAAAAGLIVLGVVIPIASEVLDAVYYHLSASALSLVGQADPRLAKQLQYNAKDSTYQFNQGTPSQASFATLNKLQQQVGTASGKGEDTSLYGLTVPTDYAKGVTYHDTNTQLSFTMVPQFGAGAGKEVEGHLVFPLSLSSKAIYTLKNNGLKEDIVVNKATDDTMTFNYTLHLPKTLEAHKLADGSIGVYSADPSLYGNMSYGSAADRAAIQKARESGEKTHLVFGLPAPVVKNTKGQPVGEAHFDLDGSSVRVVATGLSGIKGAFSIDPSVVVTSTSDFQSGNNEGMISFGTAGQITRDGLTGGGISSTPGAPAAPPVVAAVGASSLTVPNGVVNGSLVVAMVQGASSIDTPVVSAPDSSWVQAGSESYTYSTTSPAILHNVVLTCWYHYATGTESGSYNFTVGSGDAISGYTARITGGPTSGNPFVDSFHSTDTGTGRTTSVTVSSWTPSGNNNLLLAGMAAGGNGNSTISSIPAGWSTDAANTIAHTSQSTEAATGNLTFSQSSSAGMAVLIGTIRGVAGAGSGGWTATTSLPSAVEQTGAVAYNGYLYELGGTVNGGSATTTAYSAPINSDGTIGSWTTAGNVVTAGNSKNVMVYNGYIYEVGDNSGKSNVYYASIGNGTIGSWTKGTATPAANNAAGATIYQNYLYLVGGGPSGGGGGYYTTVYDAPLNADGSVGSWNTTTSLPTATGMNTAIAYNGYLYSIGGADTGFSPNVYYAPINADGSIGTWVTTASISGSKYGQYSYIYDGYIYYVGGWTNKITYYAPIYANGSLGAWQTSASLISTSGLRYVSGATYNGYMYVVAGREESTGSDVATVQVGKISSIPSATTPTVVGTSAASEALPTVTGGYQAGDLIIHQVYLEPQNESSSTATYNTPTPTTGYSWIPGTPVNSDDADMQTNITQRAYVEYKWATGSETAGTTIPITGTGGDWYGDAGTIVIRGADPGALPYAEEATGGNVGGSTFPSLSLTAGGANNLLMYLGTSWDSGDYASLSGWSQVKVTDAGVGTMLYKAQAAAGSTGTVAPAITANSNNRRTGVLLSFRGTPTLPPGNDGTVGNWQTTSGFTAGRSGPATVTYNGYVYVINGYNSTGYLNDVQYAKMNGDGTLGAWQATTSTPDSGYTKVVAFAYNGYLYLIGGYGSSGATASVRYVKINSDGSLASSWQTGPSTPNPYNSLSGAVYNGYLYILGGAYGGQNSTVYYVKINSDGSLASSWTQTASMNTARSNFQTIAYGGYLFAIGGQGTSSSNNLNTVESAAIKSDGTLGSWNFTTSFATPRQLEMAVASNGYLYVIGGQDNSSNPLGDTQYASINGGGTLGTWQTTTSLSAARYTAGSVIANGYIYLLGGNAPPSYYTTDVYYAPLHSIARVGHYSRLIDLGSATTITGLTYNGMVPLAAGVAPITYRAAGADGVFGASAPLGSIGGTTARYVLVSFALDDSMTATVPDIGSAPATLTDFTVNYVGASSHPAPAQRLRQGQTLQNGMLSPFDTSGP